MSNLQLFTEPGGDGGGSGEGNGAGAGADPENNGKPFDRIRVGNKTYGVDFSRKLRTKQVYVASEVM